MTRAWCIRAEWGTYTLAFRQGGYVAIGWNELGDLSSVPGREGLYPLYRAAYPDDSAIVTGQQVGQIARFRFEMQAGDIVITPDANTELLWYGRLIGEPAYSFVADDPSCYFANRRPVRWATEPLKRSGLSVPLQNTLRSSLTVYAISQVDELLAAIGEPVIPKTTLARYDATGAVLDQILKLDDKEFEILVAHLLTALGFEGSEVTGKSGDGGVDATGELNVANLAKVRIYVQAKRYKRDTSISAATVRGLRQAIPFGGQGAFITTAKFQQKAYEVALEAHFPRIGLINGEQLVDLLVEHWGTIPSDFQEKLGLKPGLVLAS
ncbi:MAG: restriction endonuclease [Methylocystis sp.]